MTGRDFCGKDIYPMIRAIVRHWAMRLVVAVLACHIAAPIAEADDYALLFATGEVASASAGSFCCVKLIVELMEDAADGDDSCSCPLCHMTPAKSAVAPASAGGAGAVAPLYAVRCLDSPYRPEVFRPPAA